MDIDEDKLRDWIGREIRADEILTPGLVTRFEATFDRASTPSTDRDAPVLLHFCLAQTVSITSELDPDGHPRRGGFLPPVALPRRMWAGGIINFHSPMRVGENITRRSVIDDVSVKRGKSGTLCFVAVLHELWSGDRHILTERQDIVYVGPAPPGRQPLVALEQAPQGQYVHSVEASETLLFRYSALTFNAHRIHYDETYAKEQEGYPGIVVHGPLQATMLCQFAADIHGKSPAQFRFRGRNPIFGGQDFTLNATPDGNGMSLWTCQADGPVSMEARAEW